jgi:iron(III) transport system permease protein
VRLLKPPRLLSGESVLAFSLTMAIAWLAVVPLGFLVYTTFVVDGSPSLSNVSAAFGADASMLGTLTANTMTYAVGATVLALVLATPMAYLAARTDVPFRPLLFVSALAPLVIPGVLHTIAWIFLGADRSGWLNELTELMFGVRPFNVRSMEGMIFVEATNQIPLLFLLMYAAFRSADPSLEEAALTTGARLPTVIRRVSLPLVKPSLFAGVLIMIVLAMESFEGPSLLGLPAGIHVFTSRIFQLLRTYPIEYGQAGAFALVLLTLTAIGVFAYSRLGKGTAAFETVSGKAFRARRHQLGKLRVPMGAAIVLLFVVSTVLPVGVLVLMSFQPYPSVPTMGSFTLDNYRYVFGNPRVLDALGNSLMLSIGAATIIMSMMTVAAWLVIRSRHRGAWALDGVSFLPIAIPGVVMGAALLIVYLRVPVPIYGTLWILLIAYCTRYMPYGMRYASAGLRQINSELEEAAFASGASRMRTLRSVVLPLMAPSFAAGWIFIVMSAIRELSSSILLYSPGGEVLGPLIWDMWDTGLATELSAAGVVMMVLLGILALFAKLVADYFGVKESKDNHVG